MAIKDNWRQYLSNRIIHLLAECPDRQLPDGRVPVAELPGDQVHHQGRVVVRILGYIVADAQVGIRSLCIITFINTW